MKLDEKQKKAILAVGILICLLMAGSKIYNFYQSRKAPYEVGECFTVFDPRIGDVEFKVMENDKANTTTTAVAKVEVFPGLKVNIPIRATFEEIRSSNPKKVECSE